MQFIDFVTKINHLLPTSSALKGDKVGLQIKGQKNEIFKVLIALEVNENVIKEAKSLECDIIITFHPLIFTALSEISYTERVGNLVSEIIKNNLHLYSVHTTFDVHNNGTNRFIADLLDLQNQRFIESISDYNDKGMGIIGHFEIPINLNILLERCESIFNSPIRYCIGKTELINKVAIIGGSGSSYIEKVLNSDVDCFITADNTYHNFHKLDGKIALIDLGHYEMEQFVPQHLARLLQSNFEGEVNIIVSNTYTNPLKYFPKYDYEDKQKNYLIN